MKTLKKILFLGLAVLANCFIGGTLSAFAGVSPLIGAGALNAVAAISPLIVPSNVLRAGLYQELWTGDTIKAFRNSLQSIGWLQKIRSFDAQVAENNTIHFVELGGDPTVLVNQTTYPLDIESLEDADKAIALDKYQTRPTRITDDEARGLSYDKRSTVIERHRQAVDEKKIARALHALAPTSHTDKTPVLVATGTPDGNRLRLRVADVIALKAQFDKLKVPTQGRILVLCPEHVNDLLLEDTTFAQRYNNTKTGAIAPLYGFEIYEYVDAPYYKVSSREKKKFGTAVNEATDRCASIAFYAPRMMKATGETKAYIDEPGTQYQEWRYNLRHYFICLPLKDEAIGAIVSGISDEQAPTISGTDEVALKATATAATRTFATSNGEDITASSDAAWLTVSAEGKKVTFTPQAYTYTAGGTNPRTANVTIGIVGSSVTKEVVVKQTMAEQG